MAPASGGGASNLGRRGGCSPRPPHHVRSVASALAKSWAGANFGCKTSGLRNKMVKVWWASLDASRGTGEAQSKSRHSVPGQGEQRQRAARGGSGAGTVPPSALHGRNLHVGWQDALVTLFSCV